MNWTVHRVRAGAADVHARDFDGPRGVYVIESPGESIILGSRQTTDVLDLAACAERNVQVVTRRSGGGIVHLAEDGFVWVDVVIDRGDPLWTDDVRASMRWLGDAWRNALIELGFPDSRVHDGPLTGGPLGDLVCFAGVGPGEVVAGTGKKLVGISQRRSRERARFQCTVLRAWDPGALVGLLADKQVDVVELARRVQQVDRAPAALVDALLRALP
jgi:lipoate-protein ligase A